MRVGESRCSRRVSVTHTSMDTKSAGPDNGAVQVMEHEVAYTTIGGHNGLIGIGLKLTRRTRKEGADTMHVCL